MPNLTTTAAVSSGARAFAQAGVTPAEIDVVESYDAFTINTILFHISLWPVTDAQWIRFFKLIGRPELADDRRFNSLAARARFPELVGRAT
ncbi:MAG TPA: hypothetical protein VN325_17225 [Steroidobacteraceae bacterium]|nr:hypothetical protein [Steroidobacteraceae bacterium]